MSSYDNFIADKSPQKKLLGFKPKFLPVCLFDFQAHLCDWAVQMGRCAIFADCGLGKSLIELVWSKNIIRHTNKNVLILTPLAVVPQMIDEGNKFDIKCQRTKIGVVHKGINVTNYHRLGYYNPKDFAGVVCDESSILKNFDGKTRKLITDFTSKVPYRLLATATPAPNDYMELGTSSEALGVMGRNNMLGMFFTNDGETTQQWRLKGHAKSRFWQWMASWARAVRKPSDLGFNDDRFILPKLNTKIHTVKSKAYDGFFAKIASTLREQRREKKQTLHKRCEKAASILPTDRPVIAWCQLNSESDLLSQLIPDAVEVKGNDSDEKKEDCLIGFGRGHIRAIVTKPSIASFGLNWQHCADVSYFPSHSHEQFYQAIRRCWRFGQVNEVNCNLVTSEGESAVLSNMLHKERLSDEMYREIVRHMNQAESKKTEVNGYVDMEYPEWL